MALFGAVGIGMVPAPAASAGAGATGFGASSMVRVPGGGVAVAAFLMDRHEVTVGEFRRFAEATGHRTAAERAGVSKAFIGGVWRETTGACWLRPEGPAGRRPDTREPVTQVAQPDAEAYARWAGKRLPTSTEWEHAARGGIEGAAYPWGGAPPGPEADGATTSAAALRRKERGLWRANIWQGDFPLRDDGLDGYMGRSPVGRFAANGYGLRDMAGNMWEWTATPYTGTDGTRHDENVCRGGSFLCDRDTCEGYRVDSRHHHPRATGLNNLGFRCAKDIAAGRRRAGRSDRAVGPPAD